jgi:hypothetical protein
MDSRQLVSDRHVLQANCVDQEAVSMLRPQLGHSGCSNILNQRDIADLPRSNRVAALWTIDRKAVNLLPAPTRPKSK